MRSIMFLAVYLLLFTGCSSNPNSEIEELRLKVEALTEELEMQEVNQPADTANNISETRRGSREVEELALGDTVIIDNWEITIHSFNFADTVASSFSTGSFSPPEGMIYLRVHADATNLGSDGRVFLSQWNSNMDAKIVYDNNFNFRISRFMSSADVLQDTSVSPLNTASGSIVFSVSEQVAYSDGSLKLVFEHA